jgi:hypothetical protein
MLKCFGFSLLLGLTPLRYIWYLGAATGLYCVMEGFWIHVCSRGVIPMLKRAHLRNPMHTTEYGEDARLLLGNPVFGC